MVLVIILEPVEQLLHNRQFLGTRMKRHIIALEGFHKRFRYPVAASRGLNQGSANSEPQVSGKTARLISRISRYLIGEPFDPMGEPINDTSRLKVARIRSPES